MIRPSSGIRPNRRSFLRATAAGMAGVGGSTLLSEPVSAQNEDEPAGYLVFTYDDGTIADYELTFRIHQEYDVPGCVAVSSGRVGSSERWLDADQLAAMYDAGWEVMSHAIEHRAVGEIPITQDVEVGDTEIAVSSHRHGQHPGDPIVLLDADGVVTEAVVAGRGESGDDQYLELEEPVDADVSGTDCYVRYTEEFIREILAESKAGLEAIVGEGQVTGFVYPYERHDGLAEELVPEYYDATPRAFTGDGLNPVHGPDPFTISREYYEEDRMNEAEIARFLDRVANEPNFGILASHSQYETLTEERIATTIEMARERDIEIVTLQEALDTFGVVEAPDRSDQDGDELPVTERTADEPEDDETDEEPPGLFERIVAFFRSLFE